MASVQQKVEAWDRSPVDYRFPPAEKMEMYKQMSIYNYDRFEKPETIWDIIQRWLISKFINSGISPKMAIYILIGMAALVLLFVILKLLGVNMSGIFLFSRDNKITNLRFKQGDDDIYNENLDNILLTYIENKAYRDAVRILYLLSIRKLDSNSLIDWKPWKTDKEYYYELPMTHQKQMFKSLVLNYEYIWYGQFKLEEEKFNQIHSNFESFNELINSPKNNLKGRS